MGKVAPMKVRFVQVEPTTRCNFTCAFCAGRHMAQSDLDPDVLERFLDQLEGVEQVELQGEGEPLLHSRFFDLVGMVQRRFPSAGVSMITNGSLFTPRNIDGILDHRIVRLFVSMESAVDDRFREIRGGSLERVRRGLRALLDARDRRGLTEPAVGLAITVLRSTLDETFESIAAFYHDMGLDGGITVQPLQAMPQYARYYPAALQQEVLGPAEEQAFRSRLASSPSIAVLVQARARHPGFYELLYGSTAGRNVCPWLENGLYLAVDGSVVPCCFMKDTARFGLGQVGDGDRVLTARTELAAQLARGEIPPGCTGCGTAHEVIAAQRGTPRPA